MCRYPEPAPTMTPELARPRVPGRSSRNFLKVSPGSGRLVPARSGEIDEPVELSRPFKWLIRRVRVERISGRGRVPPGAW